jgi:dedicator of cytokinesis protein 3
MPWEPLPSIAFAVAIHPFQPSSPADLPLQLGDELYIIEQGGVGEQWFRGYLVAPPSLLAGLTSSKGQALEARIFTGIFPRSCVEVREFLGDNGGPESFDDATIDGSVAGSRAILAHRSIETTGKDTPDHSNGSISDTRVKSTATQRRTMDSIPGSPLSPNSARAPASEKDDRKRIKSQASGSIKALLPLTPTSLNSQSGAYRARDSNAPKPPAPVPMLKIGDETPTSAQEPLVDEVASCLREYYSSNLHELLLNREYSKLEKLSGLVHQLDYARKQLLHDVLTNKELEDLREKTVWDLVKGNRWLGKEIIVRDPYERGRILTGDDSAVEIAQLQAMMSLLDEPPKHSSEPPRLRHLLVDVTALSRSKPEPVTLFASLWSKSQGKPMAQITEPYQISVPEAEIKLEGIATLFSELNQEDVGDGASDAQPFLVLTVVAREQSVMLNLNTSVDDLSTSRQSPTTSTALSPDTSKASKRTSMMRSIRMPKNTPWAKNIGSGSSPVSGRPSLNLPPQSSLPPKDAAIAASAVSSKPQVISRVVAVAVTPLSKIFKKEKAVNVHLKFWSPYGSPAAQSQEEAAGDGWNSVAAEVLQSQTGRYSRCNLIDSATLHVRSFAHDDPEELVRTIPTLLHKISRTEKIGFSGAPRAPRSDIYINLKHALLEANTVLTHPRSGTVPVPGNLYPSHFQIAVEVRQNSGKEIPDCILSASNVKAVTSYRSNAVGKNEHWNEVIKLQVPDEDVPTSHLYFTFSNNPSSILAFAWMPLWDQGAFMSDGDHSICLYRPDDLMPTYAPKEGYLSLPWNGRPGQTQLVAEFGAPAALILNSYLCSTVFSQDISLQKLINWKSISDQELNEILKRVGFIAEIEIVKRISEVFDALFTILVEKRGNDEFEDLVFSVLISVLGIVYDRRFNLEPLVDHYAQHEFNYPFATPALLKSFSRLLTNATHPESSRKLRATFKVGKHLFKFLLNAREQQKEKEAGVGITSTQATFVTEIRSIFKSLEVLMQNSAPILVGSQTLAVQHFHTWLPELSGIFTVDEILGLAIDFLDACANVKGKLILYKLLLIINYSRSSLFSNPESRRALTVHTARWLAPHWGKTNDVNDQYREQVRLCCSVISVQVNELGDSVSEYIPGIVASYKSIKKAGVKPKDTFSQLFPASYPFQQKHISQPVVFDEALVELSAILAAVSNLPASLHLDLPTDELATFLFDALEVRTSILKCEAFPEEWLSVWIYQHKSTMKTLETLAGILVDSFLPHPDDAVNFNTELWEAFFRTLLLLLGSKALSLETFPEQKRRAVWKIGGDVREQGADLLRRSWEAIGWETTADDRRKYGIEKMGGYQVQYVPALVAPIVELCLSVHEGLRSVSVVILQTMIVGEWELNQDLGALQAEMIDSLDRMFTNKAVTESLLQKVFLHELGELFEPLSTTDDALWNAVKRLIATVDEYLELLVAAHASSLSGEAFQVVDTLRLMEFLRDMDKEEMFIRYVHLLSGIQVRARNYTEAGLALKLHADLYDWNSTKVVDALEDPKFGEQSSFERKESIYFDMIRLFEDGGAWNEALTAYKELAQQYETNSFDYAKLARTMKSMAGIYEEIASSNKSSQERFYRVLFSGLGFPVGLREKEFIYQGLNGETISNFTDRMQALHPSAKVSATETEEDVEGQWICIQSVNVWDDFSDSVYQRARVGPGIRDHLTLQKPRVFSISIKSSGQEDGEPGEKEVQKTLYTTLESFPTILKRSEVVSVESVILSPIQNALRRTLRKTKELSSLEKSFADGKSLKDATPLANTLDKAVDPMAENGVWRYRDLIPIASMDDSDEEDIDEGVGEVESSVRADSASKKVQLDPEQNSLKVALVDYVTVLRRLMALHGRILDKSNGVNGNSPVGGGLYNNFNAMYAPELAMMVPHSHSTGLVGGSGLQQEVLVNGINGH